MLYKPTKWAFAALIIAGCAAIGAVIKAASAAVIAPIIVARAAVIVALCAVVGVRLGRVAAL